VLAILYAVINLHPASRMSDPAIQVATLVNDADAKLAGMYEVFNGGTTSIGAQLQRLQHLAEVNDPFRDRLKNPEARRLMSIHAIGVSGDFPALAALLPSKGSTSAHRYDRKSTLDQRSDRYGKPFSLLQPTGVGAFRRLESKDILDAVSRAAKETRVTYRHDILSNAGLVSEAIIFDADGSWKFNFALIMIPLMDWLRGNSTDNMHTSWQGTVPLEAGLLIYVFIRRRAYFTRAELNAEVLMYKGFPPGVRIPQFGKYLEEGVAGNLPSPTGRVKFTASQSRYWLEHGTSIMERLFKRNVRAQRAAQRAAQRTA